jgi:hypothetical protein
VVYNGGPKNIYVQIFKNFHCHWIWSGTFSMSVNGLIKSSFCICSQTFIQVVGLGQFQFCNVNVVCWLTSFYAWGLLFLRFSFMSSTYIFKILFCNVKLINVMNLDPNS